MALYTPKIRMNHYIEHLPISTTKAQISNQSPSLAKSQAKKDETMAKKGSTSQKSAISASSQSKMVLRTRKAPNLSRELTENNSDDEEAKPISAKRSKSLGLKKNKTKKKKIKIDANKPKKPPTAFFYFLEHFRKEYQAENPEVKSMRDIGKACGEKWKTMTYEEKVDYYDIATKKRAEFDRAMAEYTRRKEIGEDLESEDSESAFDGE